MGHKTSAKGKGAAKSAKSTTTGSPRTKKIKASSQPAGCVSAPTTYDADNGGVEDGECVAASGAEDSDPEGPGGSIGTRSLTESIREHVVEGGLRYHAYHCGKYPFPNDEVEQDRDDMKHLLSVTICEGKYLFAPVEDILERGAEVLDLGTGTGIWCTELADEYPKSNFLGMDLSPIQPELVPPNVQFMVDDMEHENGWDCPENRFDYIHLRHVLHSVKDRKTLMERAYRHLKPGGYFEIQEFHFYPLCDDNTLAADDTYHLRTFMLYMQQGLLRLGSDMYAIDRAETEVRAAGFEHVGDRSFKCPIGAWPRDPNLAYCGDLMKTVVLEGLVGLSRKPFGLGLGWTPLQIEMFLVEVRKAVQDRAIHSYFPLRSVYGRKPPAKKKKSKK